MLKIPEEKRVDSTMPIVNNVAPIPPNEPKPYHTPSPNMLLAPYKLVKI